MSVKRKLDTMAESLIDEAMKPAEEGVTPLTTKERVDIFKVASAWYLGNRKASKGESDDPEEGGTFADLQRRINGKDATQ
jgi:hypothetical protein